MEIKGRKTGHILKRQKVILFTLALALSIGVAFFAGALTQRSKSLTRAYGFEKSFLKHPISTTINYIKSQLVRPERIYIDIGYKNFQNLIYWRKLALEGGTLYAVEQNYLNAEMRHNDEVIPV